MNDRNSLNGTYIGRTKVNGADYLTDGLAASVLSRQLEKKTNPVRVKFTDDSIHFTDSTSRRGDRYSDDIFYDSIRKVYKFYGNPDILMVCSDGLYEDSRIYSSFRLSHENDVKRARKMIQNGYGQSQSRRYGSYGSTSRARSSSVVRYEVDKPNTAVNYEPAQYRLVSRVVRQQSRSPSPVYVEPLENHVIERVETVPVVERVVQPRTPSPIYVKTAPTVERVVPSYTETNSVEPVIYKRVTRPENSSRSTYVTRPTTNYIEQPVYPRSGYNVSRTPPGYYADTDLFDDDVVLKRVSRVPPASRR